MSSSSLDRTISKVLSQTETELIGEIDSAYRESLSNMETFKKQISVEYEKIIADGKKKAESIRRQILGSSTIDTRNKQLILLESAVNDSFEKARTKLTSSSNELLYKNLIVSMLEEGIPLFGSENVIVECNKKDIDIVKRCINDVSKRLGTTRIVLSAEPINCIGGIRLKSSDGTLSLDNTLDSRIDRLKPLIRKNVAQLLRGVA
jgi:V/A-type H+-transporting ATPase subunit E